MKIYIIIYDTNECLEIKGIYSSLEEAKKIMEILNYQNLLNQIIENIEFLYIYYYVEEYEVDNSLTQIFLFDPTKIKQMNNKKKKILYIKKQLEQIQSYPTVRTFIK